MKYYDENDNEIIIPDSILDNEINHGACATVYRYTEDLCFKRYDRGMNNIEYFLDTTTYEALRNISNPYLVNIKKIKFLNIKLMLIYFLIIKKYIKTF